MLGQDLSEQVPDLRRHSVSSPALLSLDKLSSATRRLSQQLDSLTVKASSLKNSNSAPNSPTTSMSTSTSVKTRTCHSCHAPTEIHTKIPTGVNRCPLPHWDGCPGGHVDGANAKGGEWRACPEEFVPGAPQSPSASDCSGSQKDEFEDTFSNIGEGDGVFKANDEDLTEIALGLGGIDLDVNVVNDEEEIDMLQSRNKLLKEQLKLHQVEQAKSEKERRIKLKEQIEAENAQLVSEMSGDIGGARFRVPATTPRQTTPQKQSASSLPRVASKHKTDADLTSVSWHNSYQRHLTKNQIKAAQPHTVDPPVYTGLDMNGIRKIPHLGSAVEKLVEQVQYQVPSLDRRPTAALSSLPAKPDLRQNFVTEDGGADDFLYLRRADGTIYKVPVVSESQIVDMSPTSHKPQELPASKPPGTNARIEEAEDPVTSSDDECPVAPRPGFQHVWRREPGGDKYFTEEPVKVVTSEMEYKWVKNPVTGRTSKKLIKKAQPQQEMDLRMVVDPVSGERVQMLVPRTIHNLRPDKVTGKPTLKQKETNVQPERVDHRAHTLHPDILPIKDRVPSYVSHADDKQGKDKLPLVIQYARNCPVAWTSKVTSDKLNMGLWSWGYVAELLATRTGVAPALQPGELEARMQHFLNVLEIALQPSTATDFDSQPWKVARLYAEKVQHKVDNGGSWVAFEQRYGADSHPHELMAAQIELAPKPKVAKEDIKKVDKTAKDKAWEKRPCTTWNSSQVENKCKFEAENQGRVCDRIHECSWCKDKTKRSLPHQKSFCRQRQGAGEQ